MLHVIPAVAPRYGGPSTAVVGMCRALGAAGVSTLIATTDADGVGSRLDVGLGAATTYKGVPTIFFRRTFSESFKYSASLGRWIDREIPGFDAVHIHAVFSYSSLSAARASQRCGIPYIVRPLGTLDPWSLSRHAIRKRALFAAGVRRMLERAAIVHHTSADEQRLAEAALPWLPEGRVVPLGIDDAMFNDSMHGADGVAPYVLVMSRLHEKKNIELLIAAFHELAADPSCASWSLVIAGDGDPGYVSRLRSDAERGAARSRIRFAGWVDGAERRRWLRGAGAFALPSYQENFGIAVAEALAAGVPAIVSTDVNLAADIERADAGWVVERSRSTLGGALHEAMTNEPLRYRRAVAARRLAEQFRWPTVTAGLMAMYDQVIGC